MPLERAPNSALTVMRSSWDSANTCRAHFDASSTKVVMSGHEIGVTVW
jgi:hypothetical protein